MRPNRPLFMLVAAPMCAAQFSAAALAGALTVESKIDAVTVYPDAAIVTRVAEIDLPQGDSQALFKNLPIGLDPASLRLEGEGAAGISIGAVDLSLAPAAGKRAANPIDAKVAALREERAVVQSTLDALQAKRAMIMKFAQSGPEKLSPEAKPLDIGQWGAAWDAVAAGLMQLGDAMRPQTAKAKSLDDDIAALEAQRQAPGQGEGAGNDANVSIVAAQATHATFRLSYRIADIGWQPSYDAALDLIHEPKSLALTRRASLAQRSGEDWKDVALTVSTAPVARAADVADLATLTVDFWQPPVAVDAAAPSGFVAGKLEKRADTAVPAAAPASPAREDAPKPRPAVAVQAQLAATAYAAEFRVPGRISLDSDGAQKSFVLGRLDLRPSLQLKSAPGIDPTAYLEARFADSDPAPLLAGTVSLIRDGGFVGQSQMKFVAPGDFADLGFGADDKIKVLRAPVNRKENEPTWFNQSKIETREFKTTVRNFHDFPVKVDVLDQAPVSENTAIVVDLLPITTPPTLKQVGDKRGVMSWTLELAPGEAKDIRFAYRLKWPADHDLSLGGAAAAMR